MTERDSGLTLTPLASPVDTGTPHEHIVHYRKDTLAAYPSTISILDLTIIEYRGFVQVDASTVYSLRKWYFVRMKVFPT